MMFPVIFMQITNEENQTFRSTVVEAFSFPLVQSPSRGDLLLQLNHEGCHVRFLKATFNHRQYIL